MLKKTIEYADLEGQKVTEDFYFNFSKAELIEMEMSERYGLASKIEAIVKAKDNVEVIRRFKEIIMAAYGQKSEDGRRFIKSQELSEWFVQTDAYDVLFMELITDEGAAAAFVRGIVPPDMNLDEIRAGRKMPSDHQKSE